MGGIGQRAKIIEAEAFIRHRQDDGAALPQQGCSTSQEAHEIGHMLNHMAGHQRIEAAMQSGVHRVRDLPLGPNEIHRLDPLGRNGRVVAIFLHQISLAGMVDDGGVPALAARREGAIAGADLQQAAALRQVAYQPTGPCLLGQTDRGVASAARFPGLDPAAGRRGMVEPPIKREVGVVVRILTMAFRRLCGLRIGRHGLPIRRCLRWGAGHVELSEWAMDMAQAHAVHALGEADGRVSGCDSRLQRPGGQECRAAEGHAGAGHGRDCAQQRLHAMAALIERLDRDEVALGIEH